MRLIGPRIKVIVCNRMPHGIEFDGEEKLLIVWELHPLARQSDAPGYFCLCV